MDNARKKLRVCLICVVTAAVVIGMIYYFNDMRERSKISEGTLVRHSVDSGIYSDSGRYGVSRETGGPESRG